MYKISPIDYLVKSNCILIRYGEIALKGRVTRRSFERKLVQNIKNGLEKNNISYSLREVQGRVFVQTEKIQKALGIITKIFGVTSCSPVLEIELDLKLAAKEAFNLVNESISEGQSFALRVNRSGTHEFTSQDIAVKIGAYIQNQKNFSVDLTNPDFELFIEIRDNKIYLFKNKIAGPGGMPLGTQGKIIAIIDNVNDILSSWYLMKRGCKVIFFISNPKITEQLKLFLHNWYAPSKIIMKENNSRTDQINHIIKKYKCNALCVGYVIYDSPDEIINKITYLKCNHQLPVLTPLISFDKKKVKKEMIEKGIAI